MAVAQKPKPDVTLDPTLLSDCVCVCYLCVMQLGLQAADLFTETERFGVSGGQIAGEGLNLTLKETQ